MSASLQSIPVIQKQGDDPFLSKGECLKNKLINFWQWAFSDLSNNAIRGVLAEYIIAYQLGITEGVRTEWDAYDLETKDGVKLEIKSAAYLQSWEQKELSAISFGIAPTQGWNASTNEYSNEVKRQADIYIFCLLHHKDKLTLNPLDLDQWTIYLLPTKILNEKIPMQKTIRLSSLLKLNPIETTFENIESALKAIANEQ
ncbi:MAG: hypothetical protein HON98_05050 [Chloroflexi bacterium]|jgi:hypothetical protein|nr:hypothetical protein [Chloroflexota bacterium]MBT3670238.1 hypothetical protein [Chloroflexota bacterium]MBT4004008.1 hypothetical protein [Chloroflexota bacterium]MBT4306089.1 hypothetical protein [Chloroflexota bacterium]MBT4534468.1 hypothetical protein [Chloroflexota bacterium]